VRKPGIPVAITSCAVIAAFAGFLTMRAQTPETTADGAVQVVEISAKKYEFTPSEVRVKSGTKVELKVHSVDETHGVKLELYPEGTKDKDKTKPGLIFDKPELNGKVEKDQDQVLDFVAQQPGTYQFKCAKICGMHHGSMKGALFVE
jgi:cytochrome c oxidase subunit 2